MCPTLRLGHISVKAVQVNIRFKDDKIALPETYLGAAWPDGNQQECCVVYVVRELCESHHNKH